MTIFDDRLDDDYELRNSEPSSKNNKSQNYEEPDPLDLFMQDLNQKIQTEKTQSKSDPVKNKKSQNIRQDIEQNDAYEQFDQSLLDTGAEENFDRFSFDAQGNPIKTKKEVDPLPPVDHSKIDYFPFEKNFYKAHPDIENKTSEEVIFPISVNFGNQIASESECTNFKIIEREC